jgi:hypothetical protein
VQKKYFSAATLKKSDSMTVARSSLIGTSHTGASSSRTVCQRAERSRRRNAAGFGITELKEGQSPARCKQIEFLLLTDSSSGAPGFLSFLSVDVMHSVPPEWMLAVNAGVGRCEPTHLVSLPRGQPGWRSSRASSSPSNRLQHCASPAARSHTQVSHSGFASVIADGPAFNVSERPIRLGFRGSLPPRTVAHFVFVRSVELVEQTTRPSRTRVVFRRISCFHPQSPLRAGVIFHTTFSVHFQGCQALQALASSDSPHALTGIYTLLLSTRHDACGRDPVHFVFPCLTLRSIRIDLMSGPARFELDHESA